MTLDLPSSSGPDFEVRRVVDPAILQTIYELRTRAWRARTPLFPNELDFWTDEHDLTALHWAIFDDSGAPIAAARLTVHASVSECPGNEVFAQWQGEIPAPVGLLGRLVVDLPHAGMGLARALDLVRIAAAREHGCQSVIGSTYAGPGRLRALERLGFRILGEAPPYETGPLVGLAKGGGAWANMHLSGTPRPDERRSAMNAQARNRLGALWMLAAVTSFTIEATLIKAAGAVWPAVTILFWRQLIAVVLLSPVVLRAPVAVLKISRPGLVLFRSAVGISGILISIAALAALPFAHATTISFTRILWIALIASLVMGEALTWRRGMAIAVGFAGVVALVGPSGDTAFNWWHLIAMVGALLAALTILSVKRLSRDHSVLTLTTYGALIGLALSTPSALMNWTWPTPGQLPTLLGVGVAGLVTLLCTTKALQLADTVVVAPLDYLRLVMAAVVGLVVFSEPLTPWFYVGAILIVAATLALTLSRDKAVQPTKA